MGSLKEAVLKLLAKAQDRGLLKVLWLRFRLGEKASAQLTWTPLAMQDQASAPAKTKR
jgi:hypothetical protein